MKLSASATSNSDWPVVANALQQFRGDQLVASFFAQQSEDYFQTPWYLVAVGKAALSMAQVAIELGGERLVSGLVIGKQGSQRQITHERVQSIKAGHPVPNETSLLAGQALIEWLQAVPEQGKILFLLSGGGSSLVEVLPDGWTLAQWQTQTQTWLASGWDIARINQARRSLSQIKGGRLLDYCADSVRITQLLLSDVAEQPLANVASGLLYRQPEDARVASYVLADNAQLLAYLQQQLGECHRVPACITDEVNALAVQLAQQAVTRGCVLWGGEPLVELPANAPLGGRMQHLAVAIAWQLRHLSTPWQLIALATDGSDGTTPVLAVHLTESSLALATEQGWDVAHCLQTYQTHDLLTVISALTLSGDSGTNLNDIVLLRMLPSESSNKGDNGDDC